MLKKVPKGFLSLCTTDRQDLVSMSGHWGIQIIKSRYYIGGNRFVIQRESNGVNESLPFFLRQRGGTVVPGYPEKSITARRITRAVKVVLITHLRRCSSLKLI